MDWTIVITVLSIIGVIANNYKWRWCYIIWFCTNTTWCVYDWSKGLKSQSLLFGVYIILAIHGWIMWGKGGKGKNHDK